LGYSFGFIHASGGLHLIGFGRKYIVKLLQAENYYLNALAGMLFIDAG
jgi:hypothetical protein